jgi:outer membrane protein assembly factor BamB
LKCWLRGVDQQGGVTVLRYVCNAPSACLVLSLLVTVSGNAQTCKNYFENALRQSTDLKHQAEFRVRMGTAVRGRLRGEQLFGAGGIARGNTSGTLEAHANFQWVEQLANARQGLPAWRLVRREHVRLVFSSDAENLQIKISGGQRPIMLEPQCTGGLMYVVDARSRPGAIQYWLFRLPFPGPLHCCGTAVVTQHDDNGRTGAYLSETELRPNSLTTFNNFGLLFALDVDGQVYAQPLYVPGVKMDDGTYHNVLYVATSTNHVYAFDADDSLKTKPLRQVQLGVPLNVNDLPGWSPIFPNVGITSTPVIDIDSNTMYVVAKTAAHVKGFFSRDQIFALDIGSLRVKDTRIVSASYPSSTGPIMFNADWQHNRAGLLLLKGRVYVGYGELNNEGHPDFGISHGWIFSFNAADLGEAPVVYNTSSGYSYVGIWQSGNGLASDGTYIYVNTGNGSIEDQNDFKPGQLGDSILKLTLDLHLAQSYTPSNVMCLDTCDLDLGSAGPVLLPGSDALLSGGKEGIFYVLSRRDISKLSQCAFRAADQPNFEGRVPYCSIGTDASGCDVPDPTKFCGTLGGKTGDNWLTIAHKYSNIHGSPVVLQTGPTEYQVYVWAEENRLKMFKYSGGHLLHDATTSPDPDGQAPPNSMPGGILSVSANPERKNAILWGVVPKDCTRPVPGNAGCDMYANTQPAEGALDASVPGRFVAFDANTLKELWSDPDVGFFAKFTPPTIADGKVYVANFGALSDDGCSGNYNGIKGSPRMPDKACGQIRVYGLRIRVARFPMVLTHWPYADVDPGSLGPPLVRRGD